MGVDHVRQSFALAEFGDQRIRKCLAIGCERFLGQVLRISTIDPCDHKLRIDPFFCLLVDDAKPWGIEAARYDLGKTHIFPPGQRLHFAQNIGNVPARILGQAITDGFGFEAAAERERNNMQQQSP